jgi:hypothetical protein
VPERPGGVSEQRGEPLHPPVDGDVIDLDPALGQQFLHIPIGQAVAQIPADRHRDHFRRNRNPANADRSTCGRVARGRRTCPASSGTPDRHHPGSTDATDPSGGFALVAAAHHRRCGVALSWRAFLPGTAARRGSRRVCSAQNSVPVLALRRSLSPDPDRHALLFEDLLQLVDERPAALLPDPAGALHVRQTGGAAGHDVGPLAACPRTRSLRRSISTASRASSRIKIHRHMPRSGRGGAGRCLGLRVVGYFGTALEGRNCDRLDRAY